MSFLFQLRSFSQVVRRLQVSKFSSSPVVLFDQEIKSDSFATINKKFHIDIKENDASERYIKISELAKVNIQWFVKLLTYDFLCSHEVLSSFLG